MIGHTIPRSISRTVMRLLLAGVLTAAAFLPHATAQTANNRRSEEGRLTVWVPAGIIGLDYWVYVDGRIVSAPPHSSKALKDLNDYSFVTTENGGGELWDDRGWVLAWNDRGWHARTTNSLSNSTWRNATGIFQSVELQLHAGKYNIEIAVFQRQYKHNFPFLIGQQTVVDLRRGQMAEIFPVVPQRYSPAPRVYAVAAACLSSSPPDTDGLDRTIKKIVADPMVKILFQQLDASTPLQPRSVIRLNMPPEMGGSREFDGRQVKLMIESVLHSQNFQDIPSQRQINACRQSSPEFDDAYAVYGQAVMELRNKFEPLRKLAEGIRTGAQ